MKLSGREVEVIETSYHDDSVMVMEAYYLDDASSLTEEDILRLEEECQVELAVDAYSSMIDAAHSDME